MGMVLAIVGLLLCIYGFIVILINAFKESALWGIGSLLLSPVLLVYVVMHWSDNMKPFLYYVGGVIVMIMGAAMMAPPDVATALPPP